MCHGPVRGLYLIPARFVSQINEGSILVLRGSYLLKRGLDLRIPTTNGRIYEVSVNFACVKIMPKMAIISWKIGRNC